MNLDLFTEARARADIGIERAAQATERAVPGWCEMAVEALRQFARRQRGENFIIEEARRAIERGLPEPKGLRAWGSVPRVAARRGYIVRDDGKYRAAISSNGSEKPCWLVGPKA